MVFRKDAKEKPGPIYGGYRLEGLNFYTGDIIALCDDIVDRHSSHEEVDVVYIHSEQGHTCIALLFGHRVSASFDAITRSSQSVSVTSRGTTSMGVDPMRGASSL